MALPTVTGSGLAARVIPRSALPVPATMLVSTLAALFPLVGSATGLVTVAFAEIEAGAVPVTTTAIGTEAPLGIVPRLQATWPADGVQVPWPGAAEPNFPTAGQVTVAVTSV